MTGAPVLRTERLRFDLWTDTDFEDLYALHADPRVQPSYAPGPDKWTREGIAVRLQGYRDEQALHGFTKWRLGRHDGTFLGRAGWSPWDGGALEIGYAILPVAWGHGYATEAASALTVWACATRPPGQRLVGFAREHNLASRRVLERSGLAFVDMREIGGLPHAFHEVRR